MLENVSKKRNDSKAFSYRTVFIACMLLLAICTQYSLQNVLALEPCTKLPFQSNVDCVAAFPNPVPPDCADMIVPDKIDKCGTAGPNTSSDNCKTSTVEDNCNRRYPYEVNSSMTGCVSAGPFVQNKALKAVDGGACLVE
ncbi:hypothetical protein Enr17x_05300 [Gimesia fumaroli]|uniref:Uncharacterized protein n=2 Tax=Gimesia fumaroli TaxID=2527976 RepID=A0A518I628_9PLAN|nr:hypothetical protein Enr17x_05300 [Gimesia fumaroli]